MDALRCPECKFTRAVFTLWRLPWKAARTRPTRGHKSLKTRVVQSVSKAASGGKVPSSIEGKNSSKTVGIRHLLRRPMFERPSGDPNKSGHPVVNGDCELPAEMRN